MKPIIDQSLLDQLPIDMGALDCTFSDKIEDNTGIFHVCFTMGDDREEVAAIVKHNISFDNRILN